MFTASLPATSKKSQATRPWMTKLVDWTRAELATNSLYPLLVFRVSIDVFLEIQLFHEGNRRRPRFPTAFLLLALPTPTFRTTHAKA